MSFKTKQEAFAAMQAALATIQKIKAPLPKPFQDLVDKCIKVVAANTKTADATAKKAAPDLGDKDPQGAGIDALIEKSSLPKSVKDTLLEKYNNLSDEETTIFSNFLSKLEKFYSDHKNDKAYFEAQKTTIEGLMIALIKKDGVNLQLPVVPFVNPDLGVEYKKVPLSFRKELADRPTLAKIKKCKIEATFIKGEINFTFALDKNTLTQNYTSLIDTQSITGDFILNGLKLSDTSTWGLNNGGQMVYQLANAISLGDAKVEIKLLKYFKIFLKVEGPKLSSFSEHNEDDNILSENWRLNPISISLGVEGDGKIGMIHILMALFPTIKDIEKVFNVAKCVVSGEIKIDTALICASANIGADSTKNDKKKVEQINKKAKIGVEKQVRLKELTNQQYHSKSDKKVMTAISKQIADNTKEMVEIAESITNKQQKEIAEKVIKEGSEQLLKRFALKTALRFIPVVNVIVTIYDALEIAHSLYQCFLAIEIAPTIEITPNGVGVIDTVDDLVPPHLR